MTHGISIEYEGKRVALKWHCLRRRGDDPSFSVDNLAAGLELGASMEIDLRVTRDFDFAVLHDQTIEEETNGHGATAGWTAGELAGLRYADADRSGGVQHDRPILMLGDFVARLGAAHPASILQFDMKDDLAAIGQQGVDRLAGYLHDRQAPVIVSGDCGDLILALKTRLPDIPCGIEPSFRLIDLFKKGDTTGAVAQLRAELAGATQPAMVYLHWPMILHALRQGIDLVAICRDAGRKVDAWTFNLSEPKAGFNDGEWRDFSTLLALGVDQISTDEAIATEAAYAARTGSM